MIIVVSGNCFCREDLNEKTIRKAEGTVSKIDEIKSMLTVMVFENDISFSVTEDTKITRGTEDISIYDIEINDQLLIEYYDSETPPYEAISIVDSNLANE